MSSIQRNNSRVVQRTDYEATIRHYQDINNQIERKNHEVFRSVTQLGQSNDKEVFQSEGNVCGAKKNPNASSSSSVNKNHLIVDLNQRLLSIQNELQATVHKNQQLVEEKDGLKKEIQASKENLKKMKMIISSKQIMQDNQRKEMNSLFEKIKTEEINQKRLQKDIERLSKQLFYVTSEKSKLEEKLENSKSNIIMLKQQKDCDLSKSQAAVMMKCIRKQAILIENLLKQISVLEQNSNCSTESS